MRFRFSCPQKHVTHRIIIALLVLMLSYAVFVIISNKYSHQGKKIDESITPMLSSRTGELQKSTPKFDTLLPSEKSIEDLGGWTRVSPPDRDAVFAFSDSLDGTKVIVSQQPLPKEFQSGDKNEAIEDLAKGYNANRFITATGNTKIYIGTSAKGPQSVIFTKRNLLILIKSQATITDDSWISYVNSLK